MKIGLIDVDNNDHLGGCYPNLALMKISAYWKSKGAQVGWYEPLISGHVDKCYLSKVFSFSPDYEYPIDADEVIKGGTGYCISLKDGHEVFDQAKNKNLPDCIEHIYPDYSLYGITDTAYGFMSRGCPRGCGFCHVAPKEGRCSHKVADLNEFWNGQKFISLCDPNVLACPDWADILGQLADSGAHVDFNQGLDVRLLTPEKAKMLTKIKIKHVHFAFDQMQDKDIIERNFKLLKKHTGWGRSKVSVYVLTNFSTTMQENLERIYFLRSLDFNPYVMIYDKEHLPRKHPIRRLQRWCNNKIIFWSEPRFEEYRP